jgi:hypothetical protein
VLAAELVAHTPVLVVLVVMVVEGEQTYLFLLGGRRLLSAVMRAVTGRVTQTIIVRVVEAVLGLLLLGRTHQARMAGLVARERLVRSQVHPCNAGAVGAAKYQPVARVVVARVR